MLARSKFIPILEAAHTEDHLHAKLRGVRLIVRDKIFAYDSKLGKGKDIDQERRKVVAVEEMRTYDHQSSKLNRSMHRGNEVIDNASLLSKEGSRSVMHGKVIEVQTG